MKDSLATEIFKEMYMRGLILASYIADDLKDDIKRSGKFAILVI